MRELTIAVCLVACGTHVPVNLPESASAAVSEAPNLFEQLLLDVRAAPTAAARQSQVDAFLTTEPQSPYVVGTTAVFLSVGQATFASDLNDWSTDANAAMTRIADTTLWYKKFTSIAADTRADYKFVHNGTWVTDPRNPHSSPGIADDNSELRMPKYAPSPALDYDHGVAHGYLADLSADIETTNPHQVFVYFPPGHFTGSGPYDVLVVNDGGDYKDKALLPNALDNLIAAGTIRPVVTIFVVPNDRGSEYFGDCAGSCPGTITRYLQYLTVDLLPFAERYWKISSDPAHRAIMGCSYGGYVSLRAAYEYPSLFGLVAAQSARVDAPLNGEFPALANDYTRSVAPLGVYLDVGTINDLEGADTAFDQALSSAGYTHLSFATYHDGHAWGNWRNRVADVLSYLFPAK